jgi:hypothetical protein
MIQSTSTQIEQAQEGIRNPLSLPDSYRFSSRCKIDTKSPADGTGSKFAAFGCGVAYTEQPSPNAQIRSH